jgi:uncharacterized protein (TIGR02246 family)
MCYRIALSTAVTFAIVATACQPPAQQEPAGLSAEDVAAIERLFDTHVELVMAGDIDAIAAMYTEDAAQMPPNSPSVYGREAIRDWFATFPPVTEYTFTPIEIDGRDGLAYARGAYSITLQMEGVEEPVTDTGKNLGIWKKQPDGSWLIHAGTWNSDNPLPTQ